MAKKDLSIEVYNKQSFFMNLNAMTLTLFTATKTLHRSVCLHWLQILVWKKFSGQNLQW